tara:strand:- start:149 stop:322 length:174 start_codon:yes stop_codon:yes gene_type:complete
MSTYNYKTFKKGSWHVYSEEYTTLKECLLWYLRNGRFLENLSDRKLVLFKGNKKINK